MEEVEHFVPKSAQFLSTVLKALVIDSAEPQFTFSPTEYFLQHSATTSEAGHQRYSWSEVPRGVRRALPLASRAIGTVPESSSKIVLKFHQITFVPLTHPTTIKYISLHHSAFNLINFE